MSKIGESVYRLINPGGRKPVAHTAGRAREAPKSPVDVAALQLAIARSTVMALYPDHGSIRGRTLVAHGAAAMYRTGRLRRSHCELFELPAASRMALRRQTDWVA